MAEKRFDSQAFADDIARIRASLARTSAHGRAELLRLAAAREERIEAVVPPAEARAQSAPPAP